MTIDEMSISLRLDQEEQELLESIKNDEWVSVPNVKKEIQRFQLIARQQILNQKIEVQISVQDLDKINSLANQLGQSVSSFAQNIIHKYLSGELIEKV